MVREIFQSFLVMSQQNRVFSSVSLEKSFQFCLRKPMDIDIAKTEGFKAWRKIGGGKVAFQGGASPFTDTISPIGDKYNCFFGGVVKLLLFGKCTVNCRIVRNRTNSPIYDFEKKFGSSLCILRVKKLNKFFTADDFDYGTLCGQFFSFENFGGFAACTADDGGIR